MLNFSDKEKEILDFWRDNNIFQKSVSKEAPQGDYVFYDGPPFATGLPHFGHILSSVSKDVVPRYWTMKGYRVRRRWGWDCHGLPIENLVEQKLGISGKKEIERIGVDVFNETCRREVLTYVSQWRDMIERIGRWVEFDDSYKTMDSSYMESVWWALKIIWDKGLIYQGRKVLLYCPRCETPVSKFEVAMDNSYQDAVDDAVTIKFKLKPGQKIGDFTTDDNTYVLAWTTTPWTLPGNVALTVGEEIDYMKVRVATLEQAVGGLKSGETYIFAAREDADQRILRVKAEHPAGDETTAAMVVDGKVVGQFTDIVDFKGKDLVNLEYEPLYDIPAVRATGKKAFYIAPADFVTTEEGTGVVHTAVIYGEDDYNLGVKLDLPMLPLLNNKGQFNNEAPDFIRGQGFKESEKLIIADLEQRGLLLATEKYTHPYPHCWRCESALFYNAIEAWFINIQKVKPRLIELNEKINWYPEHLKHGRFLNNLETAPDWNISRNRYWATALPFWHCEQCKETVCVGSVRELREKALNFSEVYSSDQIEVMDLHKHIIDKVKLKCVCGGQMTRIPEVIDCWVESGSMPFAEFHYPFENKEVFEKRFPGQFISEYISQTRAWFYYMHVVAGILFDKVSFTDVVTTGTILNEQGEKMSKSKRNFPDPWEVINSYGADSLRFYLMNSVVMQAENLNFSGTEVKQVYNKIINTLINVLNFYLLYHDAGLISEQIKSKNILDIWISSKAQSLLAAVTSAMDRYNLVQATRAIADFINELSTWYVRRSRDRFKDRETKAEALNTLHQVLSTLAKVIAPFLPFSAEHIWRSLASSEAESVHLAAWPEVDKTIIDDMVPQQMDSIRDIVERAHALRAKAGIKVRQPLATLEIRLTADTKLASEYLEILKEELNIETVVIKDELSNTAGWETDASGLGIALDTNLNSELKDKGAVRELIRYINSLRKEAGLKPADKPVETYQTDSAYLNSLIERFRHEIINHTSAGDLVSGEEALSSSKEVEIEGEKIILGIKF